MANTTAPGLYRFSVRLPEELVFPMKMKALQLGLTIQEFVAEAIEEKTKEPAPAKPPKRARARQEAAANGK